MLPNKALNKIIGHLSKDNSFLLHTNNILKTIKDVKKINMQMINKVHR